MTARVRLYASADHEVSGGAAAAAQAGAWLVASRRALLCQPILKPIREPLHCVEGPAPWFPLQMHALFPGGLHDHPPSTLLRDGGHAVLGGG